MSEHGPSPRPWHRDQSMILHGASRLIATAKCTSGDFDTADANAKHIVLCVNAHEDLLETCKVLAMTFNNLVENHGLDREIILHFSESQITIPLRDVVLNAVAAIAKATPVSEETNEEPTTPS